MKKIDLGQTIQILANVGVIGSIVLLAIQLNQNNSIMAANGRADRVSLATEVWSTLIEHPEMAALLLRDRQGESLTTDEEMRLNAFWTKMLFGLQYLYRDAPDRAWVAGLRRAFPVYGSLRRTWQGGGGGSVIAGKDGFSDVDFVEFMDKNVFTDQSK